MTLQSIN